MRPSSGIKRKVCSAIGANRPGRRDLIGTATYWRTAFDKPDIQLVWRSSNQPKSWIDYSEGPSAEKVGDALVFVPSRYRSWLFNGSIDQIGLKLPPHWSQPHVKIAAGSDAFLMPSLTLAVTQSSAPHASALKAPALNLASGKKLRNRWLLTVMPDEKVEAIFDASTISGAQKLDILITKSGMPFCDTATGARPDSKQLLATVVLNTLKGRCQLPDSVLSQPGVHQVAALALDVNGRTLGFLSESCHFTVARQR
jgi:hypothetical protein